MLPVYKWRLYQIQGVPFEGDMPCAVFFHEEDAKVTYDHLNEKYGSIRFVLTNVRTGESYIEGSRCDCR